MASNHETQSKPADIPGGDFEGCVRHFADDPSVDDPEALCAWLEENGKEALADPNADELLTSLGVEFVSAVDTPAQSSEWLIAKNAEDPRGDTHRWKSEVPLFVAKSFADLDLDDAEASKDDGDKQIAFAPVLVPGEVDKQGDVIPDHEIEKAAHGYLADHRKVDTDHDLFDGKGTPVESWTLKRDMSFTKPDGNESRTYPKGTWIMGIQFDDDTWSRLKSGELSGLSIYGGAKPIDVAALRDTLGIEPTETKSKGTSDTEQMSNDDNTDDDGDTADVTKEVNAESVSSFLETFKGKIDDGLSPDATVEDFVRRLIDDGDVDETSVTGLSVFLDGGSSGDGEGIEDGDDGDDGMPDAPDENEAELEMSNKQKDADGDTADGTDDGSTDADGGVLPDDTPEWAKSLSEDVTKSVESVRDDVDSIRSRVDDLEAEVKGENLNDRMDDDDFEKRFKEFVGVDEDADTDTVRKALKEQVEKGEDDTLDGSFDGLFDDEGTDDVSKSAGRNAHRNIRMADTEGDD